MGRQHQGMDRPEVGKSQRAVDVEDYHMSVWASVPLFTVGSQHIESMRDLNFDVKDDDRTLADLIQLFALFKISCFCFCLFLSFFGFVVVVFCVLLSFFVVFLCHCEHAPFW